MPLLHYARNLLPFGNGRHESLLKKINTEEGFAGVLMRERARADRNGNGFSIVSFALDDQEVQSEAVRRFLGLLVERMRETDEIGWLGRQHVGVLLFNTPMPGAHDFVRRLKGDGRLPGIPAKVMVSTYPADWHPADPLKKAGPGNVAQRSKPDGASAAHHFQEFLPKSRRPMPLWKRGLDIAGSAVGLLVLSPVFLILAVFIKSVSPGPVFFKQRRIGYGGKPFVFWKFRTMKVDVDTTAHRELLADLIKSRATGQEKPMNKLDNDPQIIPFGKFLRKSCVDELPQLINVLRGEMSLIGPRPSIPYEVENFQCWHKGRFNAVPGMTGLWQVSGKNRLTFREMIRLDIRYRQRQTMWLDVKILLLTPLAIFSQCRESFAKKDHVLSIKPTS